ncbi:hypothetical protein [Bacillus sp. CGMCC 1.60114]|uniref:hypothetical protein n=1 Tax=unclassified Bacillus (in: firmicutes) TaxID=185979 RepID=UPI0036711690
MYTYTLYDSKDSFGINKSYHIKCEIPPHRFRAIMMEFRCNKEVGENIGEFINFMEREFGESFELFDYDDIVQYDADQENSMILANLLDQTHTHV